MYSGIEYYLDFMRKNVVCTRIYVKSRLDIRFENFTDRSMWQSWLDNAFGNTEGDTVSFIDFEKFLESRCFPRTRANCDELLAYLGLEEYSTMKKN